MYFVTIVTQNRIDLFGVIKNGEMILNDAGKIIAEEWIKTPEIRKNISLGEYIIMPNHFHAIIQINYQIGSGISQSENKNLNNIQNPSTGVSRYAPGEFKSPSNNIGAIIRGFKGATTKRIKEIIRENNNSAENNKKNPGTGVLQLENKNSNNIQNNSTGVLNYRTGVLQYAPTPTIDLSKSIWQRNYWEHIIRNENEYNRIAQYIINNPVKWENDKLNGGNRNIVMEPSADYNSENWMI